MKLKLTDRDKKLLYILAIIGIVVLSYQYGFTYFSNKTSELTTKNIELSVELNSLQQKVAMKDKMISVTEEKTKGIDEIINRFAGGITQEKGILFVRDLQESTAIVVQNIAFGEPKQFYNSQQTSAQTTENVVDETTGEVVETTAPVEETTTETENNTKKGYVMPITLDYTATNEQLKDAIVYIADYKERTNIDSMSAAYDATTGNLTGSLTFNMYWLDGFDLPYTEPEMSSTFTGTSNIFGTFELPENNK